MEALEQRDREIANMAAFRKSLFDYDVEKAAIADAGGSSRLRAQVETEFFAL